MITLKHLSRTCLFILVISAGCNDRDEDFLRQDGFFVFGSHDLSSVYWKDGKMHDVEGYLMYFTDGAASGGDAYTVGYFNDDKTYRGPVYWKNGRMFKLSNISANQTPTAIAFAGNDMYIAGFEDVGEKSFPIYWKNGELHSLPGKEPYSRPTAIAVSGSDVHIVGRALNKIFDNDTILITHWKNGERIKHIPEDANEMAEDIAVSGNDVYFAGYKFDSDRRAHAKVWKNGVGTVLTRGSVASVATEVEVVGSDIYLAGQNGTQAVYWKNGDITPLETGAVSRSDVSGMVIINSEVIISGRNYSDHYDGSFLWKEGRLQEPFKGIGNGFHIDCIAPAQ
ncbi:hypothetical protein WBG78_07810 [Chryseolinea sp. T2]|uniref:hypothetical protein n=1 Tax=Chryseolinea sp. T2 TaxID=3129255 RepID=UPI003076A5B1